MEADCVGADGLISTDWLLYSSWPESWTEDKDISTLWLNRPRLDQEQWKKPIENYLFFVRMSSVSSSQIMENMSIRKYMPERNMYETNLPQSVKITECSCECWKVLSVWECGNLCISSRINHRMLSFCFLCPCCYYSNCSQLFLTDGHPSF